MCTSCIIGYYAKHLVEIIHILRLFFDPSWSILGLVAFRF